MRLWQLRCCLFRPLVLLGLVAADSAVNHGNACESETEQLGECLVQCDDALRSFDNVVQQLMAAMVTMAATSAATAVAACAVGPARSRLTAPARDMALPWLLHSTHMAAQLGLSVVAMKVVDHKNRCGSWAAFLHSLVRLSSGVFTQQALFLKYLQ